MKVIIHITEQEWTEIREITGMQAKDPAIRTFLTDSLPLLRRRQIAEKFLSGEWSAELPDYELSQSKELLYNKNSLITAH
jgi:hypothetical protein